MTKNNPNVDELIFVYNADAGLFSLVSDFAHKIISSENYACKKEFLHKDEFYR